MKYKLLGPYIEQVKGRNKDALNTNLMGVSIAKRFIPSIANIIGTDLSTYRIVHPGDFAFCPVTSRNGEKITIARYKGEDDCIISQAYTPFRVIDENELDPDYLMMWFRRPEFDRYARFHSHGSVREIFSWEEMCNVSLPIPDINEQRKIVAEYQIIEKRIENNNRLIRVLEETAQNIYHHTFVENIDPENLPEGWKVGKLKEIAIEKNNHINKENVSIYKYYLPIENLPKKCMVYGEPLPSSQAESSLITFDERDIIMGAIRPYFHKVVFARTRGITRGTCIVLRPTFNYYWGFLMCLMFQDKTIQYATAHSQGTTMPYVNWSVLREMDIVIPPSTTCYMFNAKTDNIFNQLSNIAEEQIVLQKILPLLLSKLS